ncbi:hypothetical protein FOMPIDRAFT_84536 [Fomitopsis schrenkii]|uniref:G-protein coupled receptors family 1 profile domain-containing protein n=1 Tax=Fomitopsis schrenkii TaxID=2126942 RepID=S8G214_FOMSC|nr:hypothetical protein FOMPIDRAFT_84536 [Fomitopsis schrenkii]
MAQRTFKALVTVLDFCGLILLTALLLTPARRHPIVNSIVVLCILHCIIGALPPFLWLVSPASKAALTHLGPSHKGWQLFCLADAVLLNYFTIVKSAFAISFTLPCVYLALKFTGNRDKLESQAGPQFYKRTTIALCVGPFLWASPLILELAPTLAHNPVSLQPQFVGPMCIAVNQAAQILALVLTLFPLTIAVIASGVLAFILLKCYKLPDLRRSLAVLNPIRIVRFAALLITIVVSAVLYSLVLAVWLQASRGPDSVKARHAFMFISP